ncbi:MAG: thiamine phosphate synthase [Gemmatimonadota bacterium]
MSPDALRLIVLTDRGLAGTRGVEAVVEAALEAGAPAIQLRDKGSSVRDSLKLAHRLRALTAAHDALLFVNDRFDLALAAQADGVHLGPDDLPVEAVRGVAPPGFLVGFSTDDPAVARAAERGGADYIGCGTVFETSHKQDAGAVIGPEGIRRVVDAVGIPVVAIGGIGPENVSRLRASGAAGVAVLGAVMAAPDPGTVTRRLLAAAGTLARD